MEMPQLIKHPTFGDHRGNFCQVVLEDTSISGEWVQVNTSVSVEPFTLRGLHLQKGATAQTKYIKVIHGAVLNFVVSVDPEREDFGRTYYFTIDKDHAVYLPKGFANGILTLEPNTVLQYLVDAPYSPNDEVSILWSSVPGFKKLIEGICKEPILSPKDKKGIKLDEYNGIIKHASN